MVAATISANRLYMLVLRGLEREFFDERVHSLRSLASQQELPMRVAMEEPEAARLHEIDEWEPSDQVLYPRHTHTLATTTSCLKLLALHCIRTLSNAAYH